MKWPGPQCRRYAAYGAAFGFVFPVIATIVTGLTHHAGFAPGAIAAMHAGDPLLLIIDSAPFWLGLFASFAGARTDVLDETLGRLAETNQRLEAMNAEILVKLKDQNLRLETQNEELVRLAAVKDRFLANMSHEIRTPLTAVLGFAELALLPGLPAERRESYIATILRNGEHLLAVLNDILDISKIAAGKLEVERIPCSPLGILEDLEGILGAHAREKGLAFVIKLETPIPRSIRSDPVRLRQILLNLASNAVKFTDAGSVSIYVRFAPDGAGRGRLAFDVVDTGIGMTPEQQDRLFQPFQQADASMNRRFGGTGLGLAISRPLAHALDGELAVRSVAGRGTTFTLHLDVETDPAAGEAEALARTPGALRRGTPRPRLSGRVLLAEDGEDNRLLLGSLLDHEGLEVTFAPNGAVAVELVLAAEAARKPFDLVFMDMQMPVLDGYGATVRLRERGFRGPIVALTANAMAGERERCLAAGCDDYFSKPIDRTKLLEVVARYTRVRDVAARPDDDGLLAELAAAFAAGLGERLAAIQGAAAAGDRTALRTLAHQLKGAAGGYGFADLTEAAGALGAAIDHGEDGEVAARLDELVARLIQYKAPPEITGGAG